MISSVEGEIVITNTMRLMAVLAKTGEIESGMNAYRTVKEWEKSNDPKLPEYYFAVARALAELSLEAIKEILTTTDYNKDQLIRILSALPMRNIDAKEVAQMIDIERNKYNK